MKGHGHPDWKGSLMSSTNDKTDPQQGKSPNSFKVMNIKKFHRLPQRNRLYRKD